jgi:hypothetical protein
MTAIARTNDKIFQRLAVLMAGPNWPATVAGERVRSAKLRARQWTPASPNGPAYKLPRI